MISNIAFYLGLAEKVSVNICDRKNPNLRSQSSNLSRNSSLLQV
ncbi:MAG: hypothetical protein AB4372_08380 [Xenococcus sp. (in: cyanobacteria)]